MLPKEDKLTFVYTYLTKAPCCFPHVSSLKRIFAESEWYFALYRCLARAIFFHALRECVVCVITLWKMYRWWTYDRSTSQRAMLPIRDEALVGIYPLTAYGRANEQRAQIARVPATYNRQFRQCALRCRDLTTYKPDTSTSAPKCNKSMRSSIVTGRPG